MTITCDLYKELALDRAWDEKKIKDTLREMQKQWVRRQNACNDKKELLLIDQLQKKMEEAFRFLTKKEKRKQYDKDLDKAYAKGQIKDKVEQKLKGILEQAMEYYREGKIQLAAKHAQEAIDGKINDPRAYGILARCHHSVHEDTRALNVVDSGLNIFEDDMDLLWLGARIAIVGTEDYNDAQGRINRILEVAPDQAVGHSEQIFLHMKKGDDALAFQEIDQYIESHPNDDQFKQDIAYNVIQFSNDSFVQDPKSETYIIADKAGYERCLKLREKACSIYKDEYTENALEGARYFGTMEFNRDNLRDLCWSYGVFLYVFLATVVSAATGETEGLVPMCLASLALAVVPTILTAVSFRPYWQLNRIYLTGDPGMLEMVVVLIGRGYTWIIKKALWLLWKIIKWVFWIILRIVDRGI